MKHKKTLLRIKDFSRLICLLLIASIMVLPAMGQVKKLKHEMTQEERALMPAYLQTVRSSTAAPAYPVRSIAEFEPMEGVLVAYPFGVSTALIAEISKDVKVTTIVRNSSEETTVRNYYSSAGVILSNCNFLYASHDSYWTRDYGPWFVTDGNSQIGIMDFTYNRPRPNDDAINSALASFLNVPFYQMDLTHCGGNYMTDGYGNAASTTLVLDENTSKTQAQINTIMSDYLGISNYHVVADPTGNYIKHIDCWGKFLDVDKIVITKVPTSNSYYTNYENASAYWASQTTAYGNHYQVYRVNSPNVEPYTNSLILNKKVFVPIMNNSNDAAAIQLYQQAMPGYTIIGFTGSWESTDALHCRVMGIADRGMLYIKHLPLLGDQPVLSQYEISADITPYSGQPVTSGSVKVYYKVDNGSWNILTMTLVSGNTYRAYIPGQAIGSVISYYIQASDNSGRTATHPYIGSPDPHAFNAGTATGNPPVAAFSATPVSGTTPLTVTFTDQSTNSPTAWLWNFGDGGTSTLQNPSHQYTTAGTYTVTLTVSNSYGSDDEIKTGYITVTNPGITYCTSKSNNCSSEWIGTVKIGSMTNTSTATTYSDFTSKVVSMTRGSSVSLTLTPKFSGSSYTEYWKVWIDYNKDGDFADSGEQVYSGSGKTAKSGSFTVPSSASTGTTRIRVSMKYGSSPSYCETFSYGEVEDYTANIQ